MVIKITEAERRVKAILGNEYAVTKINRYWMIYDGERKIAAKHTSLDTAIAIALQG